MLTGTTRIISRTTLLIKQTISGKRCTIGDWTRIGEAEVSGAMALNTTSASHQRQTEEDIQKLDVMPTRTWIRKWFNYSNQRRLGSSLECPRRAKGPSAILFLHTMKSCRVRLNLQTLVVSVWRLDLIPWDHWPSRSLSLILILLNTLQSRQCSSGSRVVLVKGNDSKRFHDTASSAKSCLFQNFLKNQNFVLHSSRAVYTCSQSVKSCQQHPKQQGMQEHKVQSTGVSKSWSRNQDHTAADKSCTRVFCTCSSKSCTRLGIRGSRAVVLFHIFLWQPKPAAMSASFQTNLAHDIDLPRIWSTHRNWISDNPMLQSPKQIVPNYFQHQNGEVQHGLKICTCGAPIGRLLPQITTFALNLLQSEWQVTKWYLCHWSDNWGTSTKERTFCCTSVMFPFLFLSQILQCSTPCTTRKKVFRVCVLFEPVGTVVCRSMQAQGTCWCGPFWESHKWFLWLVLLLFSWSYLQRYGAWGMTTTNKSLG